MGKDDLAIRAAFQKLSSQQQERMERIHKAMADEIESLKKGLGTMIRQYQDRVQKIYQDIQTESEEFGKNLDRIRKAVFHIMEEASVQREKVPASVKKPQQVDDLVNNPPNCSACDFPMVVLKEDHNGSGETLIHFVCPICNLDSRATVSADGGQVKWDKTQPAAG
ncbi:MAG: hypothetical protein HY509_05610 [Acidobacteria bacterium]|nr:hypothetical protein [Acidobacteriota bacterium]